MRLDKQFSDEVSEWVVKKLQPSHIGDSCLAGMKVGEEAGELLGAILARRQHRYESAAYDTLKVWDEMGDVLIALARLAAIEGTSLEDLADERWTQIKLRTHGKDSANAE